MKDISPTTLVGVAKIVLIVLCAAAWVFGFADAAKVALVMSFVGQALSSFGLINAQDAKPPDPEGLKRKS